MKQLKKLLLLLNIILVVGLAMAYLSPGTNPNENGLFSLMGVFYPILLLANMAIMLIWMLFDYKYMFISLVAILLGWNHLTGFINISLPSAQNDKGISIMTYNIKHGYSWRAKNKKVDENRKAEFGVFLDNLPPVDVFCLQETNSMTNGFFGKKYQAYNKHSVPGRGAVIWSKYPIVSGGQIDFGTKTNSCVYADLNVRGKVVRVYNMHLQSNQVSKDADKIVENSSLNEPETWSNIGTILKKYSAASRKRSLQAEKIHAHAKTSPHPVILAGDINDPPTSYSYGVLKEGMQDAFLAKGNGLGTTYGGSIPLLRIDYVLADDNIKVLDYTCKRAKYSDHYPILVNLEISDK